MEITFESTPPSEEQSFALFEAIGWNREYQIMPEEWARTLANSQYFVAAYEDRKMVGFGRVLTDGVLNAMIYEMIVHHDYQGRGIGEQILKRLVQWCNENQIRDIQLFCARGKQTFYEKNGFVARPDEAPGMQYRKPG